MTGTAVEYLVVGHVSCDLTAAGCEIGGTAAYAGRTAQIFSCNTAVVTSAHPDYDIRAALPGMVVRCVPAAASTTFTNRDTSAGRVQTLHHRAAPLDAAHIPEEWRRATIVHLAPVANELDPDIINLFSNSLVGLTPQGWMRDWDENGRVFASRWEAASHILPLAAAVILSEEDLAEPALLDHYRRWAGLLVLTQGKKGCTVFLGKESRTVPAPQVPGVDSTGAGDVFAAAYLVRLWQTNGNPWEAAAFANTVAAQSVTRATLQSKMEHLRSYLSERL